MRDPFSVVIEDDDAAGVNPFPSNEAATQAFLDSRRGATGSDSVGKRHAENMEAVLRRFLAFLDGRPIESASRRQLERFLEATEARCKHLSWLQPPGSTQTGPLCKLGLPLECATCPARQAIAKTTVKTTVSTLSGFYKFLVARGALEYNWWRDVADDWWMRTRKLRRKEVAQRRHNKRYSTPEEDRQFIENSPILWAFTYYIERRYGIRPSEALRLSTLPHYLDPALGWFRVPQSVDDTDKRLSEDPYPIDNEARRFFRALLSYRTARLERSGIDTSLLLINEAGRPFPRDKKKGTDAINAGLKRWAQRVGIEDPASFTSYLGRRAFTNTAEDNGVTHHDLTLIRGGEPAFDGAGNYIDPKRLEKALLKGSPPLGVRVPSRPRDKA